MVRRPGAGVGLRSNVRCHSLREERTLLPFRLRRAELTANGDSLKVLLSLRHVIGRKATPVLDLRSDALSRQNILTYHLQ